MEWNCNLKRKYTIIRVKKNLVSHETKQGYFGILLAFEVEAENSCNNLLGHQFLILSIWELFQTIQILFLCSEMPPPQN